MLVFSKNRKFLCFWTLGTSILTSEKNYTNVFCSAFPNLPNAVFRFSITCVVFEIVGGGGRKSTPPPGVGVRPKPPGVRGLLSSVTRIQKYTCTREYARSRTKKLRLLIDASPALALPSGDANLLRGAFNTDHRQTFSHSHDPTRGRQAHTESSVVIVPTRRLTPPLTG